LCRWLPGRAIVFVGDSSFAVHELAYAVSGRATLISRLRLDANLFAPPPPRQAHSIGRPAQKGAPLPKLKTLLAKPTTHWRRVTASVWYGRQAQKVLDITSDTALWYRRGTPPRPIRWVLVRDPQGRRAPQAFFSTDTTQEPTEIIALFVRRWQIEVTFAETRPSVVEVDGASLPASDVPRMRCEASVKGTAHHEDYHDWPRLGQACFPGSCG
jgi:hypothetical protein